MEPNFLKYVKTTAIALTQLSAGLAFSSIGPTLPSLAYNLNIDISTLSSVIVGRGIGFLIGSLISGFLQKRFCPFLYLCIGVCLMSIGLITIPYIRYIFLLVIIIGFQGLVQGINDTTCNIILIDLWKEKSASIINLAKFSFAVGATIAPFIAAPFLTIVETTSNTVTCGYNESNSSDFKSTNQTSDKIDSLSFRWAYLIYAVVPAIAFILFAYISFKENFKAVKLSHKATRLQKLNKNRNRVFFLLFIFFMLYVGVLASMETFLFSFATSCEINLSKDKAIALNTAFFFSFAVGRGLGILSATIITPTTQMCVNLSGMCTASIILFVLTFLSSIPDWLLFTAFIIFGSSFSTLFATAFLWAEQHITVTGKTASVMVAGASIGEMLIPLIIGQTFRFTFLALIYSAVIFSFVETFIFGLLSWTVSMKNENDEKKVEISE